MANENNGGTGAGGTGESTVQPGQSGNTNEQTPNPNPGGQPGVGGQGGGGGTEKSYSFKEDRTDWVPRSRLNEQSAAQKALQAKIDGLESQLTEHNNRVKQVFGVGAPSAEEAEAEKIREALYQIAPGLKHLDKLSEEQLQAVLDAATNAQSSTQNYWDRHTTVMQDDLKTEVASQLGIEKLTETQTKRLLSAYRDEVVGAWRSREAAVKRGEAVDPNDAVGRHERGDKTLIKEFAKAFLEDFFVPARRSVQAQNQQRFRPVPRGERTRQAVTRPPEINYNDEDAFKKALLEARSGG